MLYLLLAVVCGSTFAILFKLFSLRRIDTLQAVAFNYLTAFLLGLAFNFSGGAAAVNPFTTDWWWIALIMGVGFMAAFVLMSDSTVRSGVAVTTIAARVSLVIPVVCSYLLLSGQAEPPWLPIALVVVALTVIFWPQKGSTARRISFGTVLYPLCVFLLFGLNNFCLKYVQNGISDSSELATLTAMIFVAALVACVVFYVVKNRGRMKFCPGSLLGGAALGAANFFATYLTLRALESVPAGIFFPVYNVSIVVISILAGRMFFGERLTKLQTVGVLTAMVGIVLFFILPR